MENSRNINLVKIIFIGGTLLVFPLFGFAYNDQTTHPALTQEIVKFFNQSFLEKKINNEEMELVIQGSIDEDAGIRWMRHFYDPIYNRGLVLAETNWMSSKEWAENTKAQAGTVESALAGITKPFFSGEEDYSWDRAIYEYAWGDKKRGLKSLGHILHLLEDATVPDHTRNDPHPLGSPYEEWTKKFDRKNIDSVNSKTPTIVLDLNEYFDRLAIYSNNNFFSKDTIFAEEYPTPLVVKWEREKLGDGLIYNFGYHKDGFRLLAQRAGDWRSAIEEKYIINDPDDLVLRDYWSHLSEQAVLYGAGVIKLFFDEVEKEKQSKILYEKNRSWLGKKIDIFKSSVFGLASVLYGSSVTEKDLEENIISPLPEKNETPVPSLASSAEARFGTEIGPEPAIEQKPATVASSASAVSTPKESVAGVLTSFAQPATQISAEDNNISRGWTYSQSPALSSPPPSSPPPDTAPPDISFDISECGQSFSPTVCLLATTTINIFWSSTSSDLAKYNIECELNGSACSNFNFASTTATSTIYNLADNSVYTFKARAIDNAGNQSAQQIKTVEISLRPLVINEIGWAGTSAARSEDEWIELFNPTERTINLAGFLLRSATDDTPYIQLSGTIPAKGFFILERTNDTTISDLLSNQIYTSSLINTGEVLELSLASTTLDKTPPTGPCGGWCGGADNPQYWSMEKYDPATSGENQNNWGSWAGFLANGKNADNLPIKGTPGKRNSINYLIDKSATSLNQNKTLKKANSPYLVTGAPLNIQNGVTLTIEPGTVIKFFNASSVVANGIIKAEGAAAEPIIFTSFKDDSYGGDTNQDGASTTSQFGDWGSIKLAGNGSVFDRTVVRYGGLNDFSANHWANIKVDGASFTLKNSTIEESAVYGLWLTNASSTIEANIIRNNNQGLSGIGITAQDGSLNIINNTFTDNTIGLQLTSAGAAHNFTVTNNIFNQNSQYPVRVISASPAFSGNTAANNGINGTNLQGSVTQDYTLASGLPYVIGTTYNVQAGKILTILPGTIVKLGGGGGISISGKLIANGNAANKIIFTSLNDDDCGISGGCGDTNATTTSPAAGDWSNLSFLASSASSTLDYVSIRYGGVKSPLWTTPGALRAKDVSIDIKNAIVENNYLAGIWLENSTSTSIIGSTVKNHREPLTENALGLNLVSSSPFIQNTVFDNNKTGILADGFSSVQNGGGNTFINNTTKTTPAGLIP